MAQTCKVDKCESTELVHSGVAALILGGIPTETYCYSCASVYAQIKEKMDSLLVGS